MADFYFTDRKYNQLGIASTDELTSSSVIAIDDIGGQEGDYQSVEGGYRSYIATLHFSPDQSAQVKEMAKVGNFVLFKGRAGESVWTTILSSEHDPLAGTNTFVAEDASIDLINGTVGAYAASSAMTIAQYIELFAGDSGFVIGYNEIPDLTRTLKWDSDDSSILTRILSVATQFGVELSFRFEVRGLSVIGKYIDIRKHIGGNKDIYLRVDTDLNKIVTTSDIADLCTAIAGTGGTPEGSNDPITLKGYHWIDPNGRYVLGDDGVLRDPIALRTWSRLLSNSNPDPKDAHITRTKTYEATTQATLLQSVLSDLEKFNHPAVNYEVDIAKLPDNVSIGDTVYLVDEDEQLFLSARVLELTYSYSNKSGTATLGDYLIQASQVDPAYRELADQLKNIPKTVQYYPWIRYADDDKGTNMSAFPANKKYMAVVYSNKSSVPSDNPADYAGKWALIQGADGKDGVAGKDGVGIKSTQIMYAQSTSGTATPTTGWTAQVPTLIKGQYLWTQTTWLYTDNTGESGYTVSYNAKDGNSGANGIAGKDGVGIKSTVIEYSVSSNGVTKPSTGWSATIPSIAPGQFMWTRTTWLYTDGTNEVGYSVAQAGATGPKGDTGVGIPGPKGADGKTSYFHTAYANSIDGKQGFSTTDGNGKSYFGQYVDQTQADSTDPTKYSWALFKGPQGPPGVPGSKDVPYTYIQLGTPASPKKGDLWWHGTTLNDATALQYYNGSTWIDQSIQQAILNIEKLVAIEIDSAIIDSPDINAPFHHTALSDANLGKFSSGNTNMQYGHVNITGNVENDQGIADGHTMISDLGPSGFISRERTPDNAGDVQYANLQGGKLNLLTLISDENAATKKYVFSSFKSTDNVTYYWNNTTAYSNADIDWAYIHYARRNNICTVSFDVVAKGKQGWLDLVQPRAGYKPYLPQATGATLFSTSYIGATCAVYYVAGGYWRLIPSVGSGGYRGSFSYITQDEYPTGDPFF
ncbi:phage tail protein [Lacticaseibacillus paracasei]|uniref:phage tail spike protein n=1 Tax=Lacticaseibacillus paracasei TaxID=1597 RepID=UPI000742F5AC|nr:phage tail spike protein [Lacticaseibacillus paracasei]ALX88165.1 phage tail protein [Lacticaseibacillus paracasei]